jgi:tRNA A-37 threonylcarbamoyl transferase component Bud32
MTRHRSPWKESGFVASHSYKTKHGLSTSHTASVGPHFDVTAIPQEPANWLKLVRPRGTGTAVSEFSRACLIRLIDFPEMPFRSSYSETIKMGRSAILVRTELPVGGKMTSIAYKRVRRRNWFKKLTLLFRANRVLRCWKLGHEFLKRGIPTARPLAVILPRRAEAAGCAYLATEWLEGAADPEQFGRVLRPYAPRACFHREQLAAQRLGELLGRMHARGISHRDLKPGNLLLRDRDNDVEAYIIDLDGAAIGIRTGRRTRIRDLSRLAFGLEKSPAISSSARLRFLRSYLSAVEDSAWNWKTAWNELSAAVEVRRWRKIKRKQ